MSKFRWLLAAFAVMALLPSPARAQETGTVSGTVVDAATQQPLAGVQVYVAGSSRSAMSDQQGRFLILNVPAGSHEVRASLIGYSQGSQRVTVEAGQTATVSFVLSVTAIGIDELVITATGQQQRRRESGSAITTLSTEKLELAPVTNMSQLIQGRVAGATIMQSAGATGSGARVRIRGANSMSLSNAPLLIVDGVRVESSESSLGFGVGGQAPSNLNDLNPDDIESIEILKGPAAAALYGTAAANGVIQVTTKRGRAGQSSFRVWSEFGALRRPGEFPDNVIALGNLVNARDSTWVGRCDNVRLAIGANPTGNQVGCTGVTDVYRFNPLENSATTPFRDGSRKTFGASVSGGNEGMTYYFSAGFEDETGVTPDNNLERIRFQANTTAQVGEKFNIATSISYLNNELHLPLSDNSLYGIVGMGMSGSPLPSAIESTQGYMADPGYFYDWKTFQKYSRIQGSVRADYRPFSWLALNGTAGLDRYAREEQNRIPRESAYSGRGSYYTHGFIQNYNYDIWDLTTNASATATFNLTPDLVSTTAVGGQYIRENLHRIYAFGAGLTPGIETSLGGATSDFEASELNTVNATVSAYLQQGFGWRDRVFFTAALRGDQNTSFGHNIGWIWYPSFSSSWVISEESFFPEIAGLSSLRLRGAFGQSGLRPGPQDAALSFSSQVTTIGRTDVAGITFGEIGNLDLRPERSSEWDFGLEGDFFEGRLGLELGYFTKTSKDALVSRPLAGSAGSSSSRYENIGKVSNSGFEFALNGQPVRTPELQWNVNVTGSTIKNRVVDLGVDARGEPNPDIVFGVGSTQRHREGYALGSYFHFPIIGYADANGDGFLDPSEVQVRTDTVVYLGNPMPKREISFGTDVTFRDWVRVAALVDYKGGQELLNASRAWRCDPSGDANCETLYAGNASLEDQAAIIARAYHTAYTGFIEDADFVKLREISVTFMLPQTMAARFGTKGLSLTLAGRNLKTWTDYSGMDPEINYAGQANFTTAEFYTLPPNRYFTMRIDANF